MPNMLGYAATPATYSREAVLARKSLHENRFIKPRAAMQQLGDASLVCSGVECMPPYYETTPAPIEPPKPEPHYKLLHSGYYTSSALRHEYLRQYAKWVVQELEARRGTYDFVVATGVSGTAVAFAALALYDFPLVIVRKDGGNTHSNSAIEGCDVCMGRYIVIDDFIASGDTMRTINRKLRRTTQGWDAPKHVGSLLYRDSRFDRTEYVSRWDD